MNKVLTTKSIDKIYCLNPAAYNLIKTNRINSTNKTFIAYNHFKGSKQTFNYKSYKSIKLVRFWLVGMLKCFKIGINKKVRLNIYKWSLVKIMLLISNNKIREIIMDFNKIILKMILISTFDWIEVKVEFIPDKFAKDSAKYGDLGDI